MGFKYKLAQFFYGRNGADALYYACFVLFLLLSVVRVFVRNTVFGIVLYVIEAFLLFIIIFRMLSRNLPKRRRENEIFLGIFRNIKNFFILTKNRIRDIKKCRYRTCNSCKATLRLPIRKGSHTVVCPKCKNRFKVNVLF